MLNFDLLLAFFLGLGAGTFTGIVPGIHTNTVAAAVLAGLSLLTLYFSPLALGVFLIAMVVVHSFVDFIPSIFLGAPEGETSLAVLPGHKMLLEGRGRDALKFTVEGGVGSAVVALGLLPIFAAAIVNGYEKLGIAVPLLIVAFSVFFILLEPTLERKMWATIVFLLSGALGLIALNHLPVKEPLFPLFTGLFGISTLLISMLSKNKIAEQQPSKKIKFKGHFGDYFKSAVSAAVMSVLPALGAAQATVLAQAVARKQSAQSFLRIVGGINTVSAFFVLTTLFLINKARTGVVAVLKQFIELDPAKFAVLLATSLAALVFAVFITLKLGSLVAERISKIKYRKLSFAVIIGLVVLVAILSGRYGLLVASVSTSVGLVAPKAGIKRIHAMGVLAIPVVFYFI